MTGETPIVYQYSDYRAFLRDFLTYQKQQRRFFSQRYFANRAGFSAHSFLPYVINGKRNLTGESAERMIAGLGLKERSADYFRLLVKYTQADTDAEKQSLFNELNALRAHTSFYKLTSGQYAYFDEWHYPVVREIAACCQWNDDYALLGSLVNPPISGAKAHKAVKVLCETGLLERTADSGYRQTSQALHAQNMPPHLLRKARDSYIELALKASETVPADKRNISTATLALSEESMKRLSAAIDELRDNEVLRSANEKQPTRVYQLNFQLFPVSQELPGSGETL